MLTLAVVIPTRNRPGKLALCLEALERARQFIDFTVYVCDSSPDASVRAEIDRVCRRFAFAELHLHNGRNVAAARNFCAGVAREPILINVDDDVYVEPEAVRNLYETYRAHHGWRVVGGLVDWGVSWDGPVVMRRIGYGRKARPGEKPSFMIGAFFLYPKRLAELCPWNERIRYSDDVFMGALWRSYGVSLLHEPTARAVHDDQKNDYGTLDHDSHIYANLFDALIANRNLPRAAMYEVLGFAAGAKRFFRRPGTAVAFLSAWFRGHSYLVRDWHYLSSAVSKALPEGPQ